MRHYGEPFKTKVEIVKEVDPDYGDILRVHINGNPQHDFVLDDREIPNAESNLLRATIARLFMSLMVKTEEADESREFRQKLRNFLRM